MRAVVLALVAGCHVVIPLDEDTVVIPPGCMPSATGDEDRDCVADELDGCPGLADTMQLDADGDGVGDACDPSAAADAVLELETFADSTAAAARWRDATGASPWQFVPDAARHGDTLDALALLQRVMPFDSAATTVDVAFTFVAWAAGTPETTPAETELTVRLDGDPDQPNGHSCRIDPQSAQIVRAVVKDAAGNETVADIVKPDVDLAIRIRLRRTAEELRCEVTMGTAQPVTIQHMRTTTWPTSRHIAVDARRTAVAVEHVTVFGLR